MRSMDWDMVNRVLAAAKSPVLLYGPSGTGKSFAANQHAKYIVTVTPDCPMAELRGHWIPRGTDWAWQHGPCTSAQVCGETLAIHEINNAGPDAMGYLYSVLDSAKSLQLTLPNGETIRPAPGYRVICTMNGDPKESLPVAIYDRLPIKIEVNSIAPEALATLPAALRHVPQIGDHALGIRAMYAFSELHENGVPVDEAARVIFGSRADDVVTALKLQA